MVNPSRVVSALRTLATTAEQTAGLAPAVALLAGRYAATLRAGGTLYFIGNGGSAADAQHIAAEYVVRYRSTRSGLAASALTTDTSILTAAGNDLGFDEVFARQVEARCRPSDLLVIHSTSGRSANLIRAVAAARARKVPVVALLGGEGGLLRDLVDLAIVVPSSETSHIQEIHLALEHVICEMVEEELG